jgi:hypothetical protein
MEKWLCEHGVGELGQGHVKRFILVFAVSKVLVVPPRK